VLGDGAFDWLTARRVAARLVARDGTIVATAWWPTVGLEAAAS
jgi:hypothetical protein